MSWTKSFCRGTLHASFGAAHLRVGQQESSYRLVSGSLHRDEATNSASFLRNVNSILWIQYQKSQNASSSRYGPSKHHCRTSRCQSSVFSTEESGTVTTNVHKTVHAAGAECISCLELVQRTRTFSRSFVTHVVQPPSATVPPWADSRMRPCIIVPAYTLLDLLSAHFCSV